VNYRLTFDRTIDRLDELRIDYTYVKSRKVARKTLRRAEKRIGHELPPSFAHAYTNFSNGLHFSCSTDEAFGSLSVPPLKELVANCRNFKQLPRDFENFAYEPSMGLQKANAIVERMASWVPFDFDGGGDAICVECGTGSGPVVYYQHDWYDGPCTKHGHIVAHDFESFVSKWSQVCFFTPTWWPDIFSDHESGWKVDDIPEQFRL